MIALILPFANLLAQDCTDATEIEFITDCGTEFTLCVDNEVTDFDTPVTISIFSNDDLGILQACDVSISSPPSNGMVEIVENCKMKYTPNTGYVGMDQFNYKFDYWDTCTENYCEDGLHIWEITSYYTGPDNVSLEVFAGGSKIGSESIFYNNDCLETKSHCKVIDFNEQDRGRIINNQYFAEGVTISADNNNGPDLAIIFDSSNPTGDDPDLGTPNKDFGGPGEGNGGKKNTPGENSTSLGNLLIIAENSGGSSSDGTVNNPDDEADGGVIIFTFDEPVTVNNMKIIDLENGENDIIRCFDAGGNLLSTININGQGDNSVITQGVNEENVSRMEVEFQSSGALDELSFCRPFDCLNKEVILATKCPASEGVFGEEQGGMFRPLSGCIAPIGLECANPVFRAPTEISVFQTAETTVNILIGEPGLLPIEFGSISGRAIGVENYIVWEVVEVFDEEYMFLEKSIDGTDFIEIAKFADLKAGDYDVEDDNVTSKVSYYRIKSISNSGDLTYSRTIAVTNDLLEDYGIKIYPQPASDDLHFKSDQTIQSIELLDLSGKRVSFSLVNDVKHTVQLAERQAAGIYVARLLMESGRIESRKIVLK